MTKARLIANGEFLTSDSLLDPTKLDNNFGEIPPELLDDITSGLAVHDFYIPAIGGQLENVSSYNLSQLVTTQKTDVLVGQGMEMQPQPTPDSYVFKETGKYLVEAQIGLQTQTNDQAYAGGYLLASTDGGTTAPTIAKGYDHIYGGMSGAGEWSTVKFTGVINVTDVGQTWVQFWLNSQNPINVKLDDDVTHIRFMRLDS